MGIFNRHAQRVSKDHQRLISALLKYHESGDYVRDLGVVGRKALDYLRALPQKKRGRKQAMVLDIDDTCLLTDWRMIMEPSLMGRDFDPRVWRTWAVNADADAVPSTLRLYRAACQNGLDVFFVTGRMASLRKCTEANLKRAGFAGWGELFMEPFDHKHVPIFSHTSLYKTAARWSIAQRGYDIVLNMGDQVTDLNGGYAARTFKLPNPFYTLA